MNDPIELELTVACTPEHAFDVWASRTSLWWPRGHSISGDPSLTVTIEPRRGGRIFERTSEGVEHEWGEVLAWQPPHRLSYLWHIYGMRAQATEVDVTFDGHAGGTKVTIVHRGWERLGEAGPGLRQRNTAGWGGVVRAFVEAVSALFEGQLEGA